MTNEVHQRMTHDLGLKTHHSYGHGDPVSVADVMRAKGLNLIAFSDLFSIEQNDSIKFIDGINVVTGSEWHCKCDVLGIERVDLLFVGFKMTDELRTWVGREKKRIEFKRKAFPEDIQIAESWLAPRSFGERIRDRNLRRTYFGSLPDVKAVMSAFGKAGAFAILSDVPFSSDFGVKCHIIKELQGKSLKGLVSFRNEDDYQDAENEIDQSLQICRFANLLPIVSSGLYRDYESRVVSVEMARGAFDYLTRQLYEGIGYADHG